MTSRRFRFGVCLVEPGDRSGWRDRCGHAEDLGYDVLLVPDHLGRPAPFPSLVAAAEATRMRVGTFVLNTGFYRPALLGRDVTDTDRLTGGRLELGLGTGYNPAEFEAVGLPFRTGGARVDHLADMVTALRGLVDPMPPLLLAGSGARLLRVAARHADIVGFTITDPAQSLADRVELVRAEAGDRFDSLELNLFVVGVTIGTEPDLSIPRQLRPALTDDEIRSLPGMLFGSAERIAETVLRYRETMGISYFVVLEPAITDFAKVMACLR